MKPLLVITLVSLAVLNSQAGAAPVPHTYELPSNAFSAWQTLERSWLPARSRCMKRFKIRLDCRRRCESIQLHAVFRIDAKGRLAEHRVVREVYRKHRQRLQLRKCLLDQWLKRSYPKALHQRAFKVMLGLILKC